MEQYQEELHELHRILRKAIEKLGNHAKENNFLEYPYGRKPDPTPLISEADFVDLGGPDTDDFEPPFVYDYGFDPLKFLSDYIKWAHPRSVEARRQAKIDAQARLAFRAQHAITQLNTQQGLVNKIGQLRAGILWGPFLHITSDSKFMITLQPLKPSVIYVQIAEDSEFSSILQTARIYTVPTAPTLLTSLEGPILSVGTKYYARCFAVPYNEISEKLGVSEISVPIVSHLSEYDEEYANIALRWENSYLTSAWSSPSENDGTYADYLYNDVGSLETRTNVQFIGQMPGEVKTKDEIDPRFLPPTSTPSIPTYTYLLGDVLLHKGTADNAMQGYVQQLSQLFRFLLHRFPSLRNSALSLVYRDTHPLSAQYLRLEEVAHKQYRHELKKYQKKYGLDEKNKPKKGGKEKNASHIPPPPQLRRPPLTEQLQAIMTAFPSTVFIDDAPESSSTAKIENLSACRMLYTTHSLTPEVQVIVLDMRYSINKHDCSDYLGREQAEWLHHILKHSNATWKIIVSGKAFGLSALEEIRLLPPSNEERLNTPNTMQGNTAGGNEVTGIIVDSDKTDEGGVKQVSIADDHSGPHQHRASAHLYDDCDEVYGRSKYSLQYILASYQKKHSEVSFLPSLNDLPTLETLHIETDQCDHYNLFLTTGIVLLTGGVTSLISRIYQSNIVEPAVASPPPSAPVPPPSPPSRPSSRSNTLKEKEEKVRPPPSNSNVVPTPIPAEPLPVQQQFNLIDTTGQDLPAPAFVSVYQDFNNNQKLQPTDIAKPKSTDCVGLVAEISLGYGGVDLSAQSSTAKYSAEKVSSSAVDWKVPAGMDSQTVLWDTAKDVIITCELQILGNNSLYFDVHEERIEVKEKKKLVSIAICLATSKDDESLSKSDSVHMT